MMKKRRCAVELDGTFYRYSEGTLEQIVDLSDLQGDQGLVSDFQGAISRTTTVEAPYKYAEVMVRKQLQETGEFDEPVTLITHWKKRRGPNATDIFYTALPTRLYYRSLDEAKNHEDCILLFPLYGVLYGVLKKMKPTGPVAVVFQHGRFADVIVGARNRVYYANRCVSFDESPEQISSLWQMVASDIEGSQQEHRIAVEKMFLLTWITSQPEAAWPAELEEKVHYVEEESLFFEGREKKVSFLKALRDAPASLAVSAPREKLAFYCARWLPAFNLAVLAIALLCFTGHLWYAQKNRALEQAIKAKEESLSQLREQQPLAEVPYAEYFHFVKDLSRYRDIPSFKRIVNDISDALFEGSTVQVLKADYNKGNLKIEILGKVTVPFDKAFKGYQRFCHTMAKREYALVNRSFNTSINESQFMVTLEKGGG